jgi:hypothetical protein
MPNFGDRFVGGPRAEKIKIGNGSFFISLGVDGPLITRRRNIIVDIEQINRYDRWMVSAGGVDFLVVRSTERPEQFIIEAKEIKGKPRMGTIITGRNKYTLFGNLDTNLETENQKLKSRVKELRATLTKSINMGKYQCSLEKGQLIKRLTTEKNESMARLKSQISDKTKRINELMSKQPPPRPSRPPVDPKLKGTINTLTQEIGELRKKYNNLQQTSIRDIRRETVQNAVLNDKVTILEGELNTERETRKQLVEEMKENDEREKEIENLRAQLSDSKSISFLPLPPPLPSSSSDARRKKSVASELLSDIRGGIKLKKVDGSRIKPTEPKSDRGALMDSIREGVKLRKVDTSPKKPLPTTSTSRIPSPEDLLKGRSILRKTTPVKRKKPEPPKKPVSIADALKQALLKRRESFEEEDEDDEGFDDEDFSSKFQTQEYFDEWMSLLHSDQ